MVMATASLQKGTLIAWQSAPRVWAFQSTKYAAMAGYIMQGYEPISLPEMDRVALLKRVDTKYVLHIEQLFQALSGLQHQYRVLQVGGSRLNGYHNLYFDTPEFKLYHQHHNERSSRYKVRSRQYVDSDSAYLEVKRKNNRGQTIKYRMHTSGGTRSFSCEQEAFLLKNYPYDTRLLHPVLPNDFTRITLVSKHSVERLTLDINLQISKGWQQIGLPYLAIAEVKQEEFSLHSEFMQQMRAMNIMPQRFSKYCLGITLLYPHLKQNRFKPRNAMVERIMRQGVNYGYSG